MNDTIVQKYANVCLQKNVVLPSILLRNESHEFTDSSVMMSIKEICIVWIISFNMDRVVFYEVTELSISDKSKHTASNRTKYNIYKVFLFYFVIFIYMYVCVCM